MSRWPSFGKDDKKKSATKKNQNISPFLEENSREMESWEHQDDMSDVSIGSSVVSSLTGALGKDPRRSKPRVRHIEEGKMEIEDVEGGVKTPLASTPPRSASKVTPKTASPREPGGSLKSMAAIFSLQGGKMETEDVEGGGKTPLVATPPRAAPEAVSSREPRGRFKSMAAMFSFGKGDGSRPMKTSQPRRYSDRRVHYCWGALALTIFVAIIAASVILAQRNTNSDKSNDAAGPSIEDDAEAHLSPREKGLMDIFETVSSEGLNNQESPQYKAKEWMFHSDLLKLTPSELVSDERVAQRYALAVFYYSTNGPVTWEENNWLQGDECSNLYWTGISCNEDNQVRAIAFDNVGLQGTIPEELGTLTLLENLVLKNHPFLVGQIPMSLGKLEMLGQLGLYNNALTGGIPGELYDATHLNYINLQNNQLEGGLILRIEKLRNLERLILSNNKFSGGLPVRQLARTGIRFLGLSNNNFSGSLPEQISNLPLLEYLYLDGNAVTGSIPPNMGRLTNMVSFNFDHNGLIGSIPTEVGEMRVLEYASVRNNSLTGPIPTEMAALRQLRVLNFGKNALTGKLPNLSNLSNLEELHLFQNALTGSLPASLGLMSSLQVLFLSSNNFTGKIDPILGGKLSENLRGLYLSDNGFNGILPTELCDLTDLKALFLDTNEFTGTIPGCIGQSLDGLRQLFFFSNQLNGAVPTSLGQLRNLTGFGLENNNLGGIVPHSMCAINSLTDIWADCGGEVPEILCGCCSTCCPSTDCQ